SGHRSAIAEQAPAKGARLPRDLPEFLLVIRVTGHQSQGPTPPISLIRSCCQISSREDGCRNRFVQNQLVARPKRFELLTPRFVVWRSVRRSARVDHSMLKHAQTEQ